MKVVKSTLKKLLSYIEFDINSIEAGDTVPFDIYIKKDKDYVIIIEAGTLLTESLYSKLKKQEKLFILKSDESKLTLTCETLKYYIKHSKNNVEKRIKMLYEVNEKLFDTYLNNKENEIDIKCVILIVKTIVYLIKQEKEFMKKTLPFFLNDDKLSTHSLHVAIYATKLASLINLNNEQLIQIATAGLLHDVGYKKIDSSITKKTAKLNANETVIIRKHPQYSVDILKQNKIYDPYIVNAVMHHHERYDGSGYPGRLQADEISDFASILGICDVFDALTNNRSHRKAYSSYDALKMMMKETSMVNQFNQKYLLLALKSLS